MSLLSQILKMDVTTEEWNELYHKVIEKHWDTPPAVNDDYFQSARVLMLLANRDMPDEIITTAKIIGEVFKITSGKTDAVTAELHVGKHKLYFKLATSRDAIDNLQKQLANTVMIKAKNENPPTTEGGRIEETKDD